MTDISNLKPGAALTYEQAMALPDGARVSALWNNNDDRFYFTVGSKDPYGDLGKFGGAMLEREEYWREHRWHSVLLESLPSKDQPILCDRCGTTYKNDERHACPDREPFRFAGINIQVDPTLDVGEMKMRSATDGVTITNLSSEPSPGDGYRFIEPDAVDYGDEFSSDGGKTWLGIRPGAKIPEQYLFRRRIEPQVEPAKPERQASEIEKLAAMALLGNAKKELCQFAVFDKPERAVEELNIILERIGKILRDYNEAYDYAKSIGAIE